jgi:cytoskeletal protein CcmA (bactofilin family)
MADAAATLLGGSAHDTDSTEMAFHAAASIAVRDGAPRAQPVLLEPVMAVEIVVPIDNMGSVIGDVNANPDLPSILVISETASVIGEIHADHVIINGTVKGPVYARLMLELQPKAHIEGDVHYSALEMHQGAIIAGQLRPVGAIEEKPTLKLAANNE